MIGRSSAAWRGVIVYLALAYGLAWAAQVVLIAVLRGLAGAPAVTGVTTLGAAPALMLPPAIGAYVARRVVAILLAPRFGGLRFLLRRPASGASAPASRRGKQVAPGPPGATRVLPPRCPQPAHLLPLRAAGCAPACG